MRCLMKDEVDCDVSLRNTDGESALDLVDSSSGDSEAILVLLQEKLASSST